MGQVRYLTHEQLERAAALAQERGYNRQFDPATIGSNNYGVYPIVFSMLHHHAGGEPVSAHVRVMFAINETDRAMIDVDLDLYNELSALDTEEVGQ